MKAKKINEFNAKKIFYSNKNLFKEADYELKKDMEFEEKNELNCQKIFFFRGIAIMGIYNIYKFLYLILSLFHFYGATKYNLLRIPLLLLSSLLFIMFKDVKRIINNTTSLRILVFIIHTFDLFLFCKSIPDDDEPDENNSEKINYFLSLAMYIYSYLVIIIMNYIMNFLILEETIK